MWNPRVSLPLLPLSLTPSFSGKEHLLNSTPAEIWRTAPPSPFSPRALSPWLPSICILSLPRR